MVTELEYFCGFCGLRLGCIFVAVFRVIMTVTATVAVFFIYFNDEVKRKVVQQKFCSEGGLAFFMVISIPVSILIILCSYWFIRGSTSVNKAEIKRMNHYVVVQQTTFIALVASLNLSCFFLAMIEFYLTCCSVVLIRERKRLMEDEEQGEEEDFLNRDETPPPKYESCENVIAQTQLSPLHLDEGESSSLNTVADPNNLFKNVGVETDENSLIKTSIDPHVNQVKPIEKVRIEGIESEERVSENAEKELDETSVQNADDEGNTFKNSMVADEPVENVVKIFAMNPKVNP